MVRAPTYDERGMKKGAWSKEEDDKLRAYILKYGHWNWRQLPRFAGLSRCGKSCRLRWLNYLRPNLKRGGYTKEEEDLIIKLHEELGNKWSLISAKLPGRTDNEIKNHWHAYLKKRIMKEKYSSEIFSARSNDDGDQIEAAESENVNPGSDSFSNNPTPSSSLENFPLSTATSSNDEFCSLDSELDYNLVGTEDSRTVTTTSWEKFEECTGDFWTEPFLTDEDYNQDCGFSSLSKDELELAYYSYFHGNDLDLLYQVM